MPLLDHFHPPLSIHRHWQGFPSAWCSALAHHLNHGLLPPRYFAEPNVQVGTRVELDVATFEEESACAGHAAAAATTAVWAPPRPALTVPLDFTHLDVFEVQVIEDEQGPRVVAVIELISPANKDRPSHRRAFAIKCASALQQGLAVIIVDIVSSRPGNLCTELLQLLEPAVDARWPSPSSLYAVACRTAESAGGRCLEAWPEPLALGARLPIVPLWLGPDLGLPLDLEPSYEAACDSLRISRPGSAL